MNLQKKIRTEKSPEELEWKATFVLKLSDDKLRKQFIDIAQQETPAQVFKKTFDLACEHFSPRMAREFAKAAHYLAIIKRDYGVDAFEATVSK